MISEKTRVAAKDVYNPQTDMEMVFLEVRGKGTV